MEPFIGQIMMFGGTFAPRNWAFCDGQIMPIAQYQTLYSLLGTTYGGDGRTTFALPDLRSRVPMHKGKGNGLTNRPLGQMTGNETTQLGLPQLPSHSHTAQVTAISGEVTINANSGNGNQTTATGHYSASLSDGGRGSQSTYADTKNTQMAADAAALSNASGTVTVDNTGSGQAFGNIQPSIAMNYIIALEGTYPSRN
jgi:microcystin-dependent protein